MSVFALCSALLGKRNCDVLAFARLLHLQGSDTEECGIGTDRLDPVHTRLTERTRGVAMAHDSATLRPLRLPHHSGTLHPSVCTDVAFVPYCR